MLRRRLGSASCWDPDLHPVAAGVGGAAFPPRLASPRDAAPALAGELAAGVGARLSLPPGQPQAGRVLAMEGRARPGSSEREARRRGLSVCPSPLGFSGDLGASGHFRGWDGVWASVGLLRRGRLQPPPPVLAAVLVSGERPVSLEAEEGKRLKVPRDTKVSRRGWSCRRGQRSSEGKGPWEVGKGAVAAALLAPWRRRGCARVGSAEQEGEEQPSHGAWAETKIRATSRWRVTPGCWSTAEVEGMWETQGTEGEEGNGGLPSIVSVAVPFLSVFVPNAFAPQLSWIAPDCLPLITSLLHWLSCGFPLVLPLLFTHSFSGKQYFVFSLKNVC